MKKKPNIVNNPELGKKLDKYELLSAPKQIFETIEKGLFKSDLMGARDLGFKNRFDGLIKSGYEIQQFSIAGNTVYFLFKHVN